MMRGICTLMFKVTGWKYVNNIPPELNSFIFLGAPHTSNFDMIPGMALCQIMKKNTRFVIKNEWMRFPFNLIMKPAGALGINRSKARSTVNSMAELFEKHKDLVLLICPEGTRKPTENWKTGFYYIAKKANVPIVLGFADYEKKEAGLGKVIFPKDFDEDMKTIMEFYQGVKGKRPQNFKLDHRYLPDRKTA